MKRPLIIGYGNPLREDDGIGWRAAELLEQVLSGADFVQCMQLTPELATRVGEASLVIFLDAAVDRPPGAVGIREVHGADSSPWSHHLAADQLLALARQLSGGGPPAFLITGGASGMDWVERLSDAGERAAIEMAAAAVGLLGVPAATPSGASPH